MFEEALLRYFQGALHSGRRHLESVTLRRRYFRGSVTFDAPQLSES